jgi:hypothetical protein
VYASVTLTGPQFLEGFHPGSGRLFVPTLSEARVGDAVAVRVGLSGGPVRATLFGTVSLARRFGRPKLPPGVEVVLDAPSRRTAEWLSATARGEEIAFQDRAPRFVVQHALVAIRDGVQIPVRTMNVSTTGGALTWKGPLPTPGDALSLRMGDGILAATSSCVVAWIEPHAEGGARVGVRIAGTGRGARAWAKLAEAAARSGATIL